MLYDNKNIICLLKGQEKAPLIGFPNSLFCRTSSTEPCFQELSRELVASPLVLQTLSYLINTVKLTEKASFPIETFFFFLLLCASTVWKLYYDLLVAKFCFRDFVFVFPRMLQVLHEAFVRQLGILLFLFQASTENSADIRRAKFCSFLHSLNLVGSLNYTYYL